MNFVDSTFSPNQPFPTQQTRCANSAWPPDHQAGSHRLIKVPLTAQSGSPHLIRDCYKILSIVALLAVFSSLTPMPTGLTKSALNSTSASNPTSAAPERQPSNARPSILTFAVTVMHQTLETTTDRVAKTVQTSLWPQDSVGKAWIPLPVQPGIDQAALFHQASHSLVAKAVGSAEGTRRPDGGKNPAYYGHVDPGNAVWNVGTFSYQHCHNCAPEAADRLQLARLKRQFQQIQQQAADRYGITLSLEEQLNAIDLANQAPLAALDQGGFIDRLQRAKQQGLSGSDAILQARVYAYKNPVNNHWEAPGLGNTKPLITRDQARRQAAIAQAIKAHQMP